MAKFHRPILTMILLLSGAPVAQSHGFPLTLTRGPRLMLDASINGHPVRALLDSAAEVTLLDRGFATALRLTAGSSVTGQGSGKASFDANVVSNVTIQAIGLTIPDQTVAIADLSDVGSRLLGRHLDAILGREIFDAGRLAIDIEGHRISVADPDAPPKGVRLELVTDHGVETVPVKIEGVEQVVRATFDLGNGSEVLIGAALAKRMHLLTDGRRVGTKTGGGLGGASARQTLRLTTLELAGQIYKNVPAAIDEQPTASDVNIGISVLRHFLITTDFANHAVWFQPRR